MKQNGLVYLAVVTFVAFLLYILFNYLRRHIDGFKSGANTFTMYYADWCPHCKPLVPVFKGYMSSSPMTVNGKPVFLEMIESANNTNKNVKGFPTFILSKEDGSSIEYDSGDRTTDALTAWLKTKV